MKFTLLATALITAASALAQKSGSYTVYGLGSRKQQVLNNGGTVLDLAIAMLETYFPLLPFSHFRCLFLSTVSLDHSLVMGVTGADVDWQREDGYRLQIWRRQVG